MDDIKTVLAVAVLAGGAFAAGLMSAPEPEYPACLDESGASPYPMCVWEASVQGNGTGASFVSFNGGETIAYPDGTVEK